MESTLFNTTRDYIAHSRSPCSKMESLQQTHCHKLSVSLFTDQIALGNYSNHSRTRLKIGYLNMGTNPTESCKSTNQHIIHHFNLHMTLGITLYPPPAENSICFLSLLKKWSMASGSTIYGINAANTWDLKMVKASLIYHIDVGTFPYALCITLRWNYTKKMMTFYEMETIFITLKCKGIKLIAVKISSVQLENQLKPRKLGVHKRSAHCLGFAVCI